MSIMTRKSQSSGDLSTGRPIVYFDLDDTLADFTTAEDHLRKSGLITPDERPDRWSHIYAILQPMPGAIEAVRQISQHYDCFIASTSPWLNDEALSDKLLWVQHWFGGDGPENPFYKHVVFTHRKDLLIGEALIDDWPAHGADHFHGLKIVFGSEDTPDWDSVLRVLSDRLPALRSQAADRERY